MFPIRAIHQIEMTSRCNLKCAYCPSYRLPRPKLDMDGETFELALRWARYFFDRYGHGELNMAGIGESTMHPEFVRYMHRAREVMGDAVNILLATNGLLMDEAMAQAIKPMRPHVYISLHRPEKAIGAVEACKRAGILTAVSCDGAVGATNWAGQIDWPVTTPVAGRECTWITEGKTIVLADGRVTTCAFDASGCGVLACVTDDLTRFETQPYKLCASCHLVQPDSVLRRMPAPPMAATITTQGVAA